MDKFSPLSAGSQASTMEGLQQAAYRTLTKHNFISSARNNRPKKGRLQATLRFIRSCTIAILWLHALFFGSVVVMSLSYRITNPAISSLMVHRSLAGTKIKPVLFVPLKKITIGTRNVFIELEDHDFYTHFGISPSAIKEAMRINKLRGRTVVGGSTITQQLARNLFLTPKKTYLRKYLEAGSALIIEAVLGKKRIMELYLNYIEFGPGVFGLGQAARYQYKTNYTELSFEQRVRLAVIITSPLRYNVRNFSSSHGMLARYIAIMGSPDD